MDLWNTLPKEIVGAEGLQDSKFSQLISWKKHAED